MASSSKPSGGRRLKRFALRFLVMFIAILLLALGEGAVLWMNDTRYVPKTAVERVTATDYGVSTDSRFAISRIAIHRSGRNEAPSSHIVWIDLHAQTAVSLGVDAHAPRCVAVSPANESVAICSEEGTIFTWRGSLRSGVHGSSGNRALRTFSRCGDPSIGKIAFSPDGSLLAAASMSRTYVWSCPNGELLRTLPRAAGVHTFLAFANNSQTLMTCGSQANEACLWDVVSGKRLATASAEWDCAVVEAALSPNGRFIALSTDDSTIRVHAARTGQELSRVSTWSPWVDFFPDGQFLVTAGIDGDGYPLQLHDVMSGNLIGEFKGHENAIAGLVVGDDGRLHSWDVRGDIRVWDVGARRELWHFPLSSWASGTESF